MAAFKVGDRLEHEQYGGGNIIAIIDGSVPYLIQFDKEQGYFHNGFGLQNSNMGLDKHCYWFSSLSSDVFSVSIKDSIKDSIPKFKVGDRVRIVISKGTNLGREGTIIKTGQTYPADTFWEEGESVHVQYDDGSRGNVHLFRIIEVDWGYTFTSKREIINKGNKSMSLVKALKAKLSPTDRTLVKHGYLTENGERTCKYNSELDEVIQSKLQDAEDTAEFRKSLAASIKEDSEA